ncbi:peptidylprolyl isomerase [Candidatus Micrarchaeota archaeon]|nr:peptidylprolyl isomerase [Candidatus Micrarchaeota archaeon]
MKAENGDLVSVDYLGTLDDGSVFDTSIKEEAEKAGLVLRESYSPLEFTVGGGQMIKGFDEAVVGMAVGEEKTVRIPPEEAYGETNPELIMEIPLENIPEGVQVGSVLMASNGAQGTVVEIGNETVKADFNHPLAGQALNFKIIMKEITKQ